MGTMRAQKFIAALLLLALALALAACGETSAPGDPLRTPPAPAEETARPTEAPETTARPTAASAPTQAPPEPVSAETPAPEAYAGPDLEAGPPVDDAFFEDAAFFGNSLVRGLELYGGLQYGDFFGVTNAAVYNVAATRSGALRDGTPATLVDALCETRHGKIYILLGINEIYSETDYFIRLYGEVLDAVAAREPEAEIYIMSLTPVTEKKSGDDTPFTEERVLEYNAALHALAEERGLWYIDLVEALSGEDGYLPEADSTDGIHLTRSKYPAWADWLRTHYNPAGAEQFLSAPADAQPSV